MKFPFRTTILVSVFFLAQAISACAPRTTQSPRITLTSVPIMNTEVRQLTSSATGRDYDLYIRLPDGFVAGNGKKYPVLYVLDGQWDFKLLDSIYGGLQYDGFVPEMIIVGITYSGSNPDYGILRSLDYTPVHDVRFRDSGEGPKFFTFVKEQLLPFIETNYPVDASQRVLMGSSFGGTFTLYALFSEPALFHGYVAGSPVVTYGDRFAFQQEAEYANNHTDLPVRLFLSVGELEELAGPVQEFMQVLSNRNYTGLEMETRVIAGERHASNKPETYNRGLRFVFQGK
jgi:predicted alpha/beta superfamily hydrolase